MSLFTYVKIDKTLLDSEYHSFTEWQTKDVAEPFMETLEITKEGELYYIEDIREWKEDKESIIGGFLVKIGENRNKINFHGDINFYSCNIEKREGVDLFARFTNGKLEWIKSLEEYNKLYKI